MPDRAAKPEAGAVEITPEMIEAAKNVIREYEPDITDLTPARYLDPMIAEMFRAMVRAKSEDR